MKDVQSLSIKTFAALICYLLISTSFGQTYKYPVSYDDPMQIKEQEVDYGEGGMEKYLYYNYSLTHKSKTFFLKHQGEYTIMTDSLYDISIGKNPWADKLFNKSLAVGEVGYGSFVVAGSSFLTMILVTGFAAKFELDMNNRFGRNFYFVTGSLTLSSGLVGLISYGVNRYFRNRCIKVFNEGRTAPKWSFFD
jgi:hypothetical protein